MKSTLNLLAGIALCLSTTGLFGRPAIAKNKIEHHHEHGAHVHGSAKLNIAFDKLQGRIEFKSSAEAVLGFEHEAKSTKDKNKLSQVTLVFEKEIEKMIQFQSSSECKITNEKASMIIEKGSRHADFEANYTVICHETIRGTSLTFDFSQFQGLKDIDVTILADDLQKSFEIEKSPFKMEIFM